MLSQGDMLYNVHVFTAGPQISTNGHEKEFTEADLDDMVKSFNLSVHEPPVILGHQEGDGNPAQGWVKGLYREGKKLFAKVNFTEKCKELIKSGEYRKRSASFYRPESRVNPFKGSWGFRHLALLGSEVPAVKGLDDLAFMETTDEWVAMETQDFAESDLIPEEAELTTEKEIMEEANEAEPELDSEMESEAEPVEETPTQPAKPAEPPKDNTPTKVEEEKSPVQQMEEAVKEAEAVEVEDVADQPEAEVMAGVEDNVEEPESASDISMEVEELKAKLAEAEARAAKAETTSAELVKKQRMGEIEQEVDYLYREAILTPAIIKRDTLLKYAEGLEFDTLEFGEGETPTTGLFKILRKIPPAVSLSEEVPTDPNEGAEFSEAEAKPVHVLARELADTENISFTEAVKKVMFPENGGLQ